LHDAAGPREKSRNPDETGVRKLGAREQRKLGLLEAALYVTGRPLDMKTLGSVLKTRSPQKILDMAHHLMKAYDEQSSALQVLELSDGRFVMQLRSTYSRHVKRLATRQLLTPGPLRTLSFIAFKQPVTQSYVVRVRGSLAYDHVRRLREIGLIDEEQLGRTKVLRTTPTFADYFNLSQDVKTMKKQLQKHFESHASERLELSRRNLPT
jgi:segregation and condensation protein B